ncbi:MAG: glycosyltransferase [Bauldia sp.]|nr:glycosyltransferase [Bauldia sp.]
MTDTVSVIMPAYNVARFIAPALRSLLREGDDVDLDIVVVDDGSTDGTLETAAAVAEGAAAIRIVPGEHRGVAAARNRGLAEIRPESRYITFLDADDHSCPGRIRRQVDRLTALGGTGFVIGHAAFFEAIDEDTSQIIPGSRTATVLGTMLGSTLFDRVTFAAAGPFDEDLAAAEDIDMYLRLLERQVPYVVEPELALLYRRHGTNMTNDVHLIRRAIADALRRSLARRRATGGTMAIGRLFGAKSAAEEAFRNG